MQFSFEFANGAKEKLITCVEVDAFKNENSTFKSFSSNYYL
jgi:hypothetical protein